jgi:hypothetical protein
MEIKKEKTESATQENNCEKGEKRIKDMIEEAKKNGKIFSIPKR